MWLHGLSVFQSPQGMQEMDGSGDRQLCSNTGGNCHTALFLSLAEKVETVIIIHTICLRGAGAFVCSCEGFTTEEHC